MDRRNIIVIGFGLCIMVTTIMLALIYSETERQLQLCEVRLKHFEDTCRSVQGTDPRYGTYAIATIDGGKNWYAIETAQNGGIKILSPADEKYPGLVKEREAMDELVRRANSHHPADPTTPEGRKLLEDAGISVTLEKKSPEQSH